MNASPHGTPGNRTDPPERRGPPRLAAFLLSKALPTEERESVLGDMEEAWAASSDTSGTARRLWYWSQALLLGLSFLGYRIRNRLPRSSPSPGPGPGTSSGAPLSSPTPLPSTRESIVTGWLQDLRFAFRSFVHRPGFTLAAVAIMALGIGATTTIFSVVDTVLLRPLPYPEPQRLVFFENRPHAFPYFAEWRENLASVSEIGALTNSEGSVSGDGNPVHVWMARITGELLPMLGARPQLGRLFTERDHQGGGPVAVLDHGFWQQRYGSDPGIVGRQIRVDGQPVEVVGVLGPDFLPPEALTARSRVDVWLPVDETDPIYQNRGSHTFAVVARLRDGVSIEAAQAELDALTASLAQENPEAFVYSDGSLVSFPLLRLREATVRRVRGTLYMLLGAVTLMLLIACANVANLFLARGTARTGEMALRGALGASRGRMGRQLLTESAGLALAGGAGGMGLAYLGVNLFTRIGPGDVPRLAEATVDLRILLFTLGVSVATGLLCGLLPALQAMRKNVSDALREAAASTTAGWRKRRLRSALVVAELALTVVLLMGAGLLFRSMLERLQVDPGFRPRELVVVPLELGESYTREDRIRFARNLRERIAQLPETEAVAAGWTLPFVFPPRVCCWTGSVRSVDAPGDDHVPTTWIHPITPDYFQALGVPLRGGREFTDADADTRADVAIINARLARRLFGTADAVGRSLRLGDEGSITVIGVENDLHHWGLDEDVDEALYLPYATNGAWLGLFHVAVRSGLPLGTLASAVRDEVKALDPDLAPDEIVPMEQLISESLTTPRFLAILLGTFASLALLLACAGIYASMLYTVGQRRREMGIRLAMGAGTGRLSRMVLMEGACLTGLGLALGLAGTLASSRVLASYVWGVPTTDAPTLGLVFGLLTAAALAACWMPARKASREDPVQVLRE
jgi:putative ABC transport system permease protein